MRFLRVSLFLFSASWACAQVAQSVTISAGTIKGTSCPNAGISAFLNIPYAQPPTGDLRFASPQQYSGEFPSGTYDATSPGPACIQFGSTFLETGPTSEDCLHLDVWVPYNATTKSALPVKVWIYGGGEDAGGISNPLYNGCNLAKDDTVMVSINYRLGPLGFLALESAGIGGNFGIEDILLGLQWIQTNIAAFGGDPKKVLLFGQSAGATNTFIVSTLPQAKSLISVAISESGGGRDLATSAEMQPIGASFASSLGCSSKDTACIRSKSASELNAKNPTILGTIIYSGINPRQFQPFIDGKTIPKQPSEVGTKVPTIYGSNANEGALFVLGQYQSPNISTQDYTTFLHDNFGSAASTVAKAYPLTAFQASPVPVFTAMSTIITDASYFCPAYRALKLAAKNGVPAWTYLWNHTDTCAWFSFIPQTQEALELFSATHTAEIPFVFGNLDSLPLPNGTCNLTTAERDISATLISAWTAMANTSDPSSSPDKGLFWPSWNASSSLGINIGESVTVSYVNYTACELWDALDATVLNFTVGSTTTTAGSANATSSSPSSSSKSSAAGRSMSQRLVGVKILMLVVFGGLVIFL